MRHGITGYGYHQCRCDVCVEANRERSRRRRAKGTAPTHGGSGYTNHGCRCDACRAGHAEANAETTRLQGRPKLSPEAESSRAAYAAARQAETQERATKRGQVWTGAEMELVMRDDLPVKELALMLGRSYAAVTVMRRKIRSEPKYRNAAGASRGSA